jgi:uncharacterized membrane protein
MNLNFFKKFKAPILASLIAAFGGVMYVSSIMSVGFDGDEMFSANIMHFGNWFEIISIGNINDTHPPLYHTLLFFFTKIFGLSELNLRLFSVILSIVTIYLVFYLAKKMFGLKEAVISSLFMAIMWNIIVISQYARGYALLLALTALSTYALLNLIEKRASGGVITKEVLLYGATAALLMYTHYFAILVVFCQMLFVIVFFAKSLFKKIAASAVLAFALYLPWVPFIQKRDVYTEAPNFFKWFLDYVLSGFNPVFFIILLVFLSVFIIWQFVKSRKNIPLFVQNNYQLLLLFWMAFVPFIAVFIIDTYFFKCYNPRYMEMFVFYYYILFARALVLLFRRNALIFAASLVMFTFLSFKTASGIANRPEFNRASAPSKAVKFIASKFNKYPSSIVIFPYDNHFEYHTSLQNVMPLDRFKSIGFRENEEQYLSEFSNFISQKQPEYIWILWVRSYDYYPPLEFAKENYTFVFNNDLSEHWKLYLFKTNGKNIK